MLLNDLVTGSNQSFYFGWILYALLICEPYRDAVHANETHLRLSLRIIQLPTSGDATHMKHGVIKAASNEPGKTN